MIKSFEDKRPQLGKGVWIADSALVLGEVRVGEDSSIWYGTIVRGDVHSITIGRVTNIQDRCVVHVSSGTHPTVIGDLVTVGHGAIIHGCKIGNEVLVGIGAIILDGVEVGNECVIAAGSLLPPGKSFPDRSLIVGSPAVLKRSLEDEELAWIQRSAEHYAELAHKHSELTLIS
jgi:carbonic anhydrase/acetyltransferase-like protein (isoleucine patch superfamily)